MAYAVNANIVAIKTWGNTPTKQKRIDILIEELDSLVQFVVYAVRERLLLLS